MGDKVGQDFDRFVKFLARHQRRLYQHIVALLPNATDADDVLQETLLVLWKKFDQFEEGTNFPAWAGKVAYYEVLKYRQRKSREATILDDDVLEHLAGEAMAKHSVLDSRHDALRQCLERLSATDRGLIKSRYQLGMRSKDLAAQLGRTPNSLAQSFARIRRWLLDCINRTSASTQEG